MADSLFKTHLASFRVVVILVALRVLSLRPAAWQVGKEAKHVSRIKSARENGEQRLECSGRAACVAQLCPREATCTCVESCNCHGFYLYSTTGSHCCMSA